MQELITRFLSVMRSEYDIHEALLRLSAEKREAIVGSAVSDLDKIVRQEQVLLSQLGALEKRRILCAETLAKTLDVPPADVTMQSFIDRSDGTEKGELADLKEKLQDLFKELKKKNDINSKLIQSKLEYIQGMIGFAGGIDEPDAYNAQGKDLTYKPPKGKNLYDKKA